MGIGIKRGMFWAFFWNRRLKWKYLYVSVREIKTKKNDVIDLTTPTRNEIIAKAFEIHAKRNYNISNITPEVEELKENGDIKRTRDRLMRSEASEYRSYIESEARTLGLINEDIQLAKQLKPYPFEIDIGEAKRSGVFIAGGKGTTKTNLAKVIVDRLLKLGCIVKVLDVSTAWLNSQIPYVYEAETDYVPETELYQSVLYDLSNLTPKDVKSFIAKFLAVEWKKQRAIPKHKRKWIIYVFEETQMLTPQGGLRSNEAQQTLRLMSSGRNIELGFIAITQRPALADTSVFELSFQRYFARMDGENDKNKVAQYIGSLAEKLEDLNLGEFFYDFGRTTKWIYTEEFKPKTKPRRLQTVSTPKPSVPIQLRPKQSTKTSLSGIALLVIWLCILWICLK